MLKTGTVVDASIIAAPSSTKNKDGQRDPEMHQTKKANHWHFGMKVHIGVDAQSGLVHSVIGTAANVNDVTQASALLHGNEEVVFADSDCSAPKCLNEKVNRRDNAQIHKEFGQWQLETKIDFELNFKTRCGWDFADLP